MTAAAADPPASDASNARCSCCDSFVRVVCLDFLNPATPFLQFLRKVTVVNGGFIAVVLGIFFTLGVFTILVGTDPASAANLLSLASYLVRIVGAVVPYAYAQKTGAVPDWAICTLMYSTVVGGIMSCLTKPGFPFIVYVATFAIFAAICDIPRRPVFYCFLAVEFMLSAWNSTALATGGAPLVAPGTPPSTVAGLLLQYGVALVVMAVPTVACGQLILKSRKLLSAAEAANELSRNVAELLRTYDTDGVSYLLEEYAALPDADPELVQSYRALVDNLERYRPHLPNWMVGTGDESEVGSQASRRSSMTSARQGANGTPTGSSVAARVRSVSLAGAKQGANGTPNGSSVAARVRSASNAGSGAGTAPAVPVALVGAPYNGVVAFATVQFATAAERTFDGRCEATNGFVDTVHSLAAATNGAIHSFVGDTVQLSWNAAMRTAQPDVKSVRFMCRLRAAMAKLPELARAVASGAAMTGKASSQFAGTGRVSALTVSLPWHGALLACAAFAKRFGAFVTSGGLADSVPEAAAHVCRMQPVEQLRVAIGAEEHTVTVHEILDERDDDNDEWMYVMSKQGANAKSAAHRAFDHCVAGEYAQAIALLSERSATPGAGFVTAADAPSQPLSPLGAHLLERAEAALLTAAPVADFSAASCPCHSC
jgi:hypothetical protein